MFSASPPVVSIWMHISCYQFLSLGYCNHGNEPHLHKTREHKVTNIMHALFWEIGFGTFLFEQQSRNARFGLLQHLMYGMAKGRSLVQIPK